MDRRRARLTGTLLGTAIGDALGLVAEGMSPRAIARRWGRVERFHLLGRIGVVSDDTEQSALVAQALGRNRHDVARCVRALRWSLLGWFARLPWGIGLGTLRACVRMALGLRRTGVDSAGNGAAMRSAIVGVVFAHDPVARIEMTTALAELTHIDARAVGGAVYVAALSARCAQSEPHADRAALVDAALADVTDATVRDAVTNALRAVAEAADTVDAGRRLGNTGFVVHTVALATYAFVKFGDRPMSTLTEVISAGGDTDSIAAITGAWLGALHGDAAWPEKLVDDLADGPFGARHLRALGDALADGHPPPSFSATVALARNVALFPVILVQGVRALVGRG